jgi:hypothetical protein
MAQSGANTVFVRLAKAGEQTPQDNFRDLGDRYLQQFLSLRDLNQLSVTSAEDRPLVSKLLKEARSILARDERRELAEFIERLTTVFGPIASELQTGGSQIDVSETITINSPEVAAVIDAMMERGLRSVLGPDKAQMIAQALVSSAVSGFEILVGSVARAAFQKNKTALEKTDREFTLEELLKYDSIDEARNELLNRRVEALMMGSVDDWSNWCKRTLGFEFPSLTPDWLQVREIFARRNVITHNAARINSRFLKIVNSSGLEIPEDAKIGDTLITSREYVDGTIEILMALGLCLIQAVWRKLYPRTTEESSRWLVNCQDVIVHSSLWRAVWAISHHLADAPKDRLSECRARK